MGGNSASGATACFNDLKIVQVQIMGKNELGVAERASVMMLCRHALRMINFSGRVLDVLDTERSSHKPFLLARFFVGCF